MDRERKGIPSKAPSVMTDPAGFSIRRSVVDRASLRRPYPLRFPTSYESCCMATGAPTNTFYRFPSLGALRLAAALALLRAMASATA